MIIGVDLDDVLGDFSASFIRYHNERYGSEWKREAMKSYYFHEFGDIDYNLMLKRIFEFYETEDFMQMEPMKGARASLERLAKDYRLVVMTGRPDSISEKTEKWIEKNFPNIFSEVCFTNIILEKDNPSRKEKSFYCRERGISIMIDDYLEVAEDCVKNNIKILLYSAPWNMSAENSEMLIRVNSWNEILERVGILER